MYDLVVKNGIVVDPSQGIHEHKDVAVLKGRIAEVRRGINSSGGKLVDASGKIVMPGIIDLHTHCCHGITHLGVDPELACLAKGSTTVLDAGSTGELNFMGFRRYVIDTSKTRIFALLNIESLGMIEYGRENQKWPELITGRDEMFINPEGTLDVAERNRDVILGLKWAHHGLEGFRLASETAEKAGCFLMAENRHQPEALKYMRKGDILTHIYRAPKMEQQDGLLDENEKVKPEFFDAIKREVVLDVGHGAGSFTWGVAEEAFDQGTRPDTISTDLHTMSLCGPVYDMPTTMSKFLFLGMSLDEIVEASTTRPAKAFSKQDEIGTLRTGTCADLTILKMQKGKFAFFDVKGDGRIGRQRLTATSVIRKGEVVF